MKQTYQLPDLPYDFSALEPVLSAEIMELHYTKHHQAYVNNLNIALEQYHEAEIKKDLPSMIALQSSIRFHGGGHVNHSIFWKLLVPCSQRTKDFPTGALSLAIDRDFGSFDHFKEQFTRVTLGVQGSGWGFLGYNKVEKCLVLTTSSNQDPVSMQGFAPLLCIDVWEHAYYLQYKNVRADYVKAIWQIFSWDEVECLYQIAQG